MHTAAEHDVLEKHVKAAIDRDLLIPVDQLRFG